MEIRKVLKRFDDAPMGGGGAAAASDKATKWDPDKISEKLTKMLEEANNAYTGFTTATTAVDEGIGAGGVLTGAVGGIQEDWTTFQTSYKAFIDYMEAVKGVVEGCGGDYDTFNKNLTTTFTKASTTSPVTKPGAGAGSSTAGIYATTK